jgi:hypothetical protein
MYKIQLTMEKSFRYSICEPLKPEIIEKGQIDQKQIVKTFQEFPWGKYLTDSANEFENTSNKNGLTASAVGDPGNFEFYLFYKRPKMGSKLFGLIKKLDENYISDITGQTEKDVIECLNALIRDDVNFLENKFK